MRASNNPLDSQDSRQVDDWVVESCLLDLIPDEERPCDLDGWADSKDWKALFASAQARLSNTVPVDDTCWPISSSPTFLDLADASHAASWFLDMKAARARALLAFDDARFEYASHRDDLNRQSLRQQRRIVRNTLEAINLDSLAAFGTVLRKKQPLTAVWGVLAALLHSEVCASGTTADVSYGMARAFDGFFEAAERDGLLGDWGWLFKLLSLHNHARGCNHQRDHLECIRLLEPVLEKFTFPTDQRYVDLAKRLVFFPAVFTLGDSLQDCHRAGEATWWLRRARDEHDPSAYWKTRLDVELASLNAPESTWAEEQRTQPKLMNHEQRLRYVTRERKMAVRSISIDVAQCVIQWADALKWTIGWHEDDKSSLLGKIQGVAQSVRAMTAALKSRFANENHPQDQVADARALVAALVSVLDELADTIARINDPVFGFLSPHDPSEQVHRTSKHTVLVWRALKPLLPALQAAIDFHDDHDESSRDAVRSLESWRETLERRLRLARKDFAGVAAEQSIWEVLNNSEKLCSETDDPRHRTPCVRAADRPNCVQTILRLQNAEGKAHVASTDYLLRRMARTDAEFARFLNAPSAERDHNGTAPVTPTVEFISLRRWNSFSPNLASRATTTVGGGYLVRVWKETPPEYIGIAVDPGYNYLENLFDEGFTLPDVHVVVVTHAHPDHVENLSNILTLLRERTKRLERTSRVFLVLTEGVFRRFKSLIDNELDVIHDVVVLSWSRSRRDGAVVHVLPSHDRGTISLTMGEPLSPPLLSIRGVRAIHSDGTDFDSMGVILDIPRGCNEQQIRIGFTGDTRYTKDLCEPAGFAHCDVVVPHLGSMLSNGAYKYAHESWKVGDRDRDERLQKAVGELASILTNKNHLYLPGIAMLLCDLAGDPSGCRPLVVLSEFGEELRGGLRADLAIRLERVFDMTVLPADVGLRVGVEQRSVRCAVCRQYVPATDVRPVAVSDEDEALMFVCADCYGVRQHELPALLAGLRKATYELHPDEREPASAVSPGSGETRLHPIASGSASGEGRPDANLQPPIQS